jgi:hypothetical protein
MNSCPDTRDPLIVFKHLGTRALQGSSTRRVVQLYEPVIKSRGGYCERYGPRVPSPTIYLAQQAEDDQGGKSRGLGATTDLEITVYQEYLPPS